MSFKLWTATEVELVNVTPIVGNISWRSSIDELGQELNFEVAYSDMPFFPKNPIEIGNMMVLKNENNDEVLRSIAIDKTRNGRGPISYTSFDAAFYLNKSRAVYQFNGTAGDKAIRKILNDFNITIGSITAIPTMIDHIYNGESPSDIIRDILDQARKDQGVVYRMEMRQGKLYIERQTDLVINARFDLAANIRDFPANTSIADPTRKRSIENMKNSIVVVKDEEVVLNQQDQPMIDKYGLLQEVEQVNDMNDAQIRNLARNRLNELSKVFEENSLTMLGDDRVRAGRLLDINEPVTGMSGRYLVTSANHSFKNGIHTMTLDLEGV